ncbi:hypothetical protein A3K55_01830 [Candidatus Shapirobacteria bacterium RBG_13_44_7]|uniref:Uncharacterized protein n=1 Tax=Candidatus Shapirobacteria bacterium RBG_13_44_7 TaxID=1802149 RepID=A0A1F7SKT5_9BACT|nr:MAG: hypothetical protein A3K55_01830 [Candidatus Shapirobacteria bacterium RBG_13_44_7]
MSKNNSCDCCSQSSGFAFGLICGAILGAIVAIYFYKNSKTDVLADLKKKLEDFFQPTSKSSKNHKKSVVLPKTLETKPSPPSPKPKAKAKLFRK